MPACTSPRVPGRGGARGEAAWRLRAQSGLLSGVCVGGRAWRQDVLLCHLIPLKLGDGFRKSWRGDASGRWEKPGPQGSPTAQMLLPRGPDPGPRPDRRPRGARSHVFSVSIRCGGSPPAQALPGVNPPNWVTQVGAGSHPGPLPPRRQARGRWLQAGGVGPEAGGGGGAGCPGTSSQWSLCPSLALRL